ncbi:MAG: hypothetical protein IPI46_00745 [Bacteroidetes bacterium]|nr:hypothetical protein [Bacteroidota bacterium]
MPIPIELMGVKQGLSQGYISSIMQDKEGFMWFASFSGLNKYDGYEVTTYQNNPKDIYSLPDNMVSGITEDEYENFWVATRNKGLFLFDKKNERFYSVQLSGLKGNYGITNISIHGRKLFINSNTNALLYHIDSLKLIDDITNVNKHMHVLFDYDVQQKKPNLKPDLSSGNQIIWQAKNQIWMQNPDTIIHYKANKNYKNWETKGYQFNSLGIEKNKHSNTIFEPHMFDTNIMFALTNNRLQTLDIGKTKVIKSNIIGTQYKQSVNNMSIASLRNGNLLIRIDHQIFHYNIHTNELIDWGKELTPKGISCSNSWTGIDGINWFGTAGFGAIKSDIRKQYFHAYFVPHNASLFHTLDSNQINRLPAEIFNSLDFDNITQDQQGRYWVFSNIGLFICYQPSNKTVKYFPIVVEHHFRSRLLNDKLDRLWMFLDKGSNKQFLHQINKKNGSFEKSFKIPVGPINNQLAFVRDLYSDDAQRVYLATGNGLYLLNPHATDSSKMWKIFQDHASPITSLSSKSLWCICPDPISPSKYLWLGSTSNGFERFEIATGKSVHYSEDDGLPNNVVYGILSDHANNLWLSTNKGLSCFNPSTKTFKNFTSEDGLSGDEFNHFEYMKLKNGELLFGGIGGYTIFNPEEVLQKQKQFPILFTSLSISNKVVDWKHSNGVLDAPISYAKKITLQPTQGMFTINFASLEYRSNQKKFYKYKLLGFENDWTEPTNKNEATFTNLSPGNYTLLVTGTNSDGVWNTKGISIEIIMLPSWYQTWWFKIGIALLCMVALYSLYRYRLSAQLKVFKVRNRIATDLHDEIGSTLSSIAMYSEAAQKIKSENEKINLVINKIHANTTEVLESMSDIVWAVNTKNDHLHHLLNRMRDFAVQLSEAKGFTLQMTDNKDLVDLNLDIDQRKNIYLIFKEAMNNAAKYSKCHHVQVSLRLEKQILILSIKDDGIGFDQAFLKNNGGGNGLFNMKKRALDINASLNIKTKEFEGTEIEIHLILN